MKIIGTIIALMAVWLAALSVHEFNQAGQLTQSVLELKAANDQIARLEQRVQGSEKTVRDLQAELQKEGDSMEAASSMAALRGPVTMMEQPTPVSSIPATPGRTYKGEPAALAGFDSTTFFSGSGPAAPQDLGKAAIFVLQTANGFDSYGSGHPGMNQVLQNLASASDAILQDNGSDPSTTAYLQQNFSNLLGRSIALASAIANRPTGPSVQTGAVETAETIQQTQQLGQMLNVIKDRKGP
jgi:hypothetical protein